MRINHALEIALTAATRPENAWLNWLKYAFLNTLGLGGSSFFTSKAAE